MNTRFLLSFFVLLLVFSCSKDDSGNNNTEFGMAPENPNAQILTNLINQIRSSGFKCGNDNIESVPDVTWNQTLADVATAHSQDLNDNLGELTHSGSDGLQPNERVANAGFEMTETGIAIENLAKGFTSEEDVMNAWKDSQGHCINLMDSRVSEFGVGTAGPYWTMVLARH